MNATLTVNDPLADQEVTVVITLAVSDQPRDERPALISVGVAEQMPVIKTGTFGNALALIHEAWTAFGVRAQVDAAAPEEETAPTSSRGQAASTHDSDRRSAPADEEQIVATASANEEQAAPIPALKPPAKNLSLF